MVYGTKPRSFYGSGFFMVSVSFSLKRPKTKKDSKNPGAEKHRGFYCPWVLRLSRRADGAGARASAAFDAGIRVDFELAVTLRNRTHRALRSASAAGDAFVRNLISHK